MIYIASIVLALGRKYLFVCVWVFLIAMYHLGVEVGGDL